LSCIEWAMIGSIGRHGENPKIPSQHRLALAPEMRRRAYAFNLQIRGCPLQSQNVDNGFDRYIRHFGPAQTGTVTPWLKERLYGAKGRPVFTQQGTHRCYLSGRIPRIAPT
jgi:hypothetical protein